MKLHSQELMAWLVMADHNRELSVDCRCSTACIWTMVTLHRRSHTSRKSGFILRLSGLTFALQSF